MTSDDPGSTRPATGGRDRRALIDEVFGETEQAVTSDELADPSERRGLGDDFWEREKPPHW